MARNKPLVAERRRNDTLVFALLLGVPLLCLSAAEYSKWTLFIPHVWVGIARGLVWVAVAVLLIAVVAIASRRRPDSSHSHHLLAAVLGGVLFGFGASEVFFVSAALLNPVGATAHRQCFVLKELPGGGSRRGNTARVFESGWEVELPFASRYRASAVDLSQLQASDHFMLEVRRGFFGYTAFSGQRPVAGCDGNNSATM